MPRPVENENAPTTITTTTNRNKGKMDGASEKRLFALMRKLADSL